MSWTPTVGRQTENFLRGIINIPPEQKDIIKDESLRIIKSAGQPHTERNKIGLIVGYVQSGKTLSLTCVSSLARDNGYGHIIILCGVTNELFNQNMNRVIDDLITPSRMAFTAKKNPRVNEIEFYKGKFKLWKDSNGKNSTVVTFLLKHSTRINALTQILGKLKDDNKGVSTLIIDDEAHMAGLNSSFTKDEESSVYAELRNLRSQIHDYAYLQYTATPQAPLLVRLTDCVSPEFANVLTPGKGYFGGKQFFPESGNNNLVIEIPDDELPESNDADIPICPPKSFVSALRIFLVGVADNLSKDDREAIHSMLIHPDRKTIWQYAYQDFTRNVLNEYAEILDPKNDDDDDRTHLIDDFRKSYNEIKRTHPKIAEFKSIIHNLSEAIQHAISSITVVNSYTEEKINWSPATILIGGEVLGVGFTVKRLTVTYMLRTSVKGQIDSMQQRARFFGYPKDQDLNYSRVFLSQETHAAFKDYVKHEEATREELKKMQESGESLKKWRRNFLIRAGMQLTRKNIQSLSTVRQNSLKQTYPLEPYFMFEEHNPHHIKVLDDVTKNWGLELDRETKSHWTDAQKHFSGYFDASTVLDRIIAEFNWGNLNDGAYWDSNYYLLKLLANEAKNLGKEMKIKVMVMRPSERGKGTRTIHNDGTWDFLQGRSDAGKHKEELRYPGDKLMADPNVTTLQLHCYTFVKSRNNNTVENIVVPIIIPPKLVKRNMEIILQDG